MPLLLMVNKVKKLFLYIFKIKRCPEKKKGKRKRKKITDCFLPKMSKDIKHKEYKGLSPK